MQTNLQHGTIIDVSHRSLEIKNQTIKSNKRIQEMDMKYNLLHTAIKQS